MAKRDSPEFWVREIGKAQRKRTEFAQEQEWDKIRTILDTGAHQVALETESPTQEAAEPTQATFVNLIWSFAQTFIPAVYWRQPQVSIKPIKEAYIGNAGYVSKVINNGLKLTKFRKALRRSILDLLAFGHGWIKLGWYTRFGQIPKTVVDPQAAKFQKPSTVDRNIRLEYDQPFALRRIPMRMLVDPYANDDDEIEYIIEESYINYDAAKKDPYLKHTKDVSPIMFSNEMSDSFLTGDADDSNEYMQAPEYESRWSKQYEIWDRDSGQVRILLQGSEKWNRELDWPYPEISGFPYKRLTVTDAIKDMWPASVVLPWLPLVEELAFLRCMRMDAISRMNPKGITRKGMFSKEQIEDFRNPAPALLEIQGDPKGAIERWDGIKPDPNLYASENEVKEDIRHVSGLSEILTGNVPYSRIAATTSALMAQNANIRFDLYSERVGEFIVDCAECLFLIMRRFQTYPMVVEMTGDPDPQWIEISAENLQGEYTFDINPEDMLVANRAQRKKEAYDNLVALSPFGHVVKVERLVKDLLIADGKTEFVEYIQPPAGAPLDPSYENALMMSVMPVEPNPDEDFQTHLTVHRQFLESQQFATTLQQMTPDIQQKIQMLFSEHIQKTLRMSQLQQQLGPPVGSRMNQQLQPGGQNLPRPQPSPQQGQASITSQPMGGAVPQGGM